jgi:3-deoxy-D-manno-octulosonic acid kinase
VIERVLPVVREVRVGAWTLLVEEAQAEPLLEAGLRDSLEGAGGALAGGAPGEPAPDKGPSGRGTHRRLALKDGRAVILRRYRHGGWLAPLTGERFLGNGRFRREFDLGRWAWAAGVPTPRPVAVGWRAAGLTHRGCLATLEVVGARDVLALLSEPLSPNARLAAARAAARAVRALHDAAIVHADLHLKNILVEEGPGGAEGRGTVVEVAGTGPPGWIVDLDLARREDAPLSLRARIANLARLARSAEKHRRAGQAVDAAEIEAFCEAYFGDDREGRRAAERALKLARLRAKIHGRA